MSKNKAPNKSWLTKLSHSLLREPKNQQELLTLLSDAESRSLINADALHQIKSIIEFSELTVSDVMIPRGQMVTLEADATVQDALAAIAESAHSRFPVLNESHDNVEGILLAKDLLPVLLNQRASETQIKSIMRACSFVPETKHIDALLNEFRSKHAHMAVVVDEYGHIAGLITIEDILEEIVGDIIDETDPEKEPQITRCDDQSFNVDALITIEDFNSYFNSHFSDEDHDTLAGLICEQAGSLPNIGEAVELDGFHCQVLARSERRLTKIKVTPLANND